MKTLQVTDWAHFDRTWPNVAYVGNDDDNDDNDVNVNDDNNVDVNSYENNVNDVNVNDDNDNDIDVNDDNVNDDVNVDDNNDVDVNSYDNNNNLIKRNPIGEIWKSDPLLRKMSRSTMNRKKSVDTGHGSNGRTTDWEDPSLNPACSLAIYLFLSSQ